MKLSNRIALFVGILILTVAGGLGFTAGILSYKTAYGEAENGLKEASSQGANYIDSQLHIRTGILEQVAIRISGMELDQQLELLKAESEKLGYLDMAVVDLQGKAAYAVEAKEADLSDRVYVQRALQGESCFSDVLISKVTNSTVIMYAVPIKSGDSVVGALIGRRDGAALNEIVSQMHFGENGSAFILSEEGTFFAYANKEYVLEQKNIIKDIEENGPFRSLGEEFLQLGDMKQGIIKYSLEGKTKIAAVTTIPDTNWVLGLEAPESQVMKGVNKLIATLIIFSVLFVILGVAAAVFLGSSISKPISNIVALLNSMSQYDMKLANNRRAVQYVKKTDEIGTMARATLALQENLRSLVENIAQSAEHIAASSEELSATSQQAAESANEVSNAVQDIANGASDQASDTEKGANEIELLGNLIETDLELITHLNNVTEEVERMKDEGFETLELLVRKNNLTNRSATDVRGIIIETNASVNKIGNASQMILNIAGQTNLLALNAAIEAARAGEAGKGFTVVAEEIRKLAEQSNRFSSEIISDIEDLTGKSQYAVKSIEEITNILEEQTKSIDYTNTKFDGIAGAIEKLRSAIGNLNTSSQEMGMKKDEIVGIIQNLSAISEENAAGTEEATASIEEQTASMNEIASSSESLSGLAEEMQKSISKFIL